MVTSAYGQWLSEHTTHKTERKSMTDEVVQNETASVSAESIAPVIDQESRNMALLTWIGTLFFGFIPGLIIYLVKKDDAYVNDQAKEALNWSLTALMGYFIGIILSFILIGVLVFPVVGICHLVFCIMGAIGTSKGNAFRVPFAIRLLK